MGQLEYLPPDLGKDVVRAVLSELQQAALCGEPFRDYPLVLLDLRVGQGGGPALFGRGGQGRCIFLERLALQPLRFRVHRGGLFLRGAGQRCGEGFELAFFLLHRPPPRS